MTSLTCKLHNTSGTHNAKKLAILSRFTPARRFLLTSDVGPQTSPFLCSQPYDATIDDRFHYLLHSCKKAGTLDSIQPFHALTITVGLYARQPIYFVNNVISLYGSISNFITARKVFDEMPQRNSVSYNTLINAYSRDGLPEECWELFMDMRARGLAPTQFTFAGLLSCDGLDLLRGRILHSIIVKNAFFFSESYSGTALMGLLGMHGLVHEVIRVFDDMPVKSLVSWNSTIALFGHHGFVKDSVCLFRDLMALGCGVCESTLVGLISGIGRKEELDLGDQLHCLAKKTGFYFDMSVSNSLLNMYLKCGTIELAEMLFEGMKFHDIVSYNTYVFGLARSQRSGRAFELFHNLVSQGISLNEITYVGIITCCASLQVLYYGKYIHAKLIRSSLHADVNVGCALVDFYGNCKMFYSAHQCFSEIHNKNIISWNTLLRSYPDKYYEASFSLLKKMLQLGFQPNEFTLSNVLKTLGIIELQQLHSLTLKLGYHENEYVLSSLGAAYAKNGLIPGALMLSSSDDDTQLLVTSSNIIAAAYNRIGEYEKSLEMLSLINEPDNVSWNILISACSHKGYYAEAFELLKDMRMSHYHPDEYTFVSILCICTNLCSLMLGRSVHGLILKSNLDIRDTFVGNMLVDMYGKCGSIEDSVKVFCEIEYKNLFTWTALISALGRHGYAWDALERFKEMEALGFEPDCILFVSLLSACRHGGFVEQGLELFSLMERKYGIKPKLDHYQIMVDLLAKNGRIREAEKIIRCIPSSPNAMIWHSFLKGRRKVMDNKFVVGHIT